MVYPETVAADEILVAGPVDRISWEEAQALPFREARLGEHFGPLWSTWWFRIEATVPQAWKGGRVDLLFVSHSEAQLWIEGRPLQGLNTGGAGERPDARLLDEAEGGERLSLQVELACNGMFGRQHGPYLSLPKPTLDRCDIALYDPAAWSLLHDFETLRSLEADGDADLDPSFAGELRAGLERFSNVWRPEAPEGWKAAQELLAVLLGRTNGARTHELVALGHAHIDTAWLWPIAETRRKLVRTVSSQLRYLEEYPEYRFACSQAQQYAWIREGSSELWERVRAAVGRGQLVPVGGSWVEPDCNLVSGESLLRQFLHGQRWFERELGIRCREFWSPDAFGYPGQLPQLMRAAGLTRFLTQKLSWNKFNKPEHHTFVWQGIDGSEVLGHFPPGDTYSSEATVGELRSSARAYRDHDSSAISLLLFGHGDGGGGPTRTMLESLRRARDLQGVPRTSQRTSEEFFDALEAEDGARPVVVGELYFEYHRGVYTSQARTKLGNRRAEGALHDAEFLVALVGDDVPRAELDRLWKLLLLQQFHDILPGSSIGLVHEEAERDLSEVVTGANAISAGVLGEPGNVAVNTIGFERREVAEVPGVGLRMVAASSYGFGGAVEARDEVRLDGLVLENGHLRATLAEDGTLVSLLEKGSGREALAAAGNRLELYDDLPVAFDAWDIDPAHLETRRDAEPAASCRVVTSTPLRVEIGFARRLGTGSTMTQTVRLEAESRRLEFHTNVDWRERHTLLKVCFPLAVRAPNASYETAFGYAERPTHYSTSFDRARYEVPGHRWADLSEHGFGVALLTDSKYGYSCFGGELRISLLRSPTSPDPEADQGPHSFAYAIVPHAGGWREAGIVAEGARFNTPLRWTSLDRSGSLAAVDDPNVVLDTIKPAEDSDAVVLRLYEAHGARGTARVSLGFPFSVAARANALEEEEGDELDVEDGAIVLAYRPHEVATVVVR